MVYRKATLRKMAPVTRKYARLLGEMDSVLRKGKNLVEEIARLEHDSRALAHATERGSRTEVCYCPKCDRLLTVPIGKPDICPKCGGEVYRYEEEEIEEI